MGPSLWSDEHQLARRCIRPKESENLIRPLLAPLPPRPPALFGHQLHLLLAPLDSQDRPIQREPHGQDGALADEADAGLGGGGGWGGCRHRPCKDLK